MFWFRLLLNIRNYRCRRGLRCTWGLNCICTMYLLLVSLFVWMLALVGHLCLDRILITMDIIALLVNLMLLCWWRCLVTLKVLLRPRVKMMNGSIRTCLGLTRALLALLLARRTWMIRPVILIMCPVEAVSLKSVDRGVPWLKSFLTREPRERDPSGS